MIYTIREVQRDVRICLDQNMESGQLLTTGDVDTLTLDEIIKSKIQEAVRAVHSQAPAHMLGLGHNFGETVFWDTQESGHVMLPEDFMRLVVFEMSDWERPLYRAISTEDPEYAHQHSRFKGIRGTPQRPVCAIGIRPEGRVLEFYSCRSRDAKVRRGVYIPEPQIDCGEGIEISGRCYRAVVYEAAGMVLLTLGETDKANLMIQAGQRMLV